MDRPWARVAVDVVGPLPRTPRGKKYLLTLIDHGSRYPEVIPMSRVGRKKHL